MSPGLHLRSRLLPGLLLLLVICLGLGSRRYAGQLPSFFAGNAGDTLWTIAVYLTLFLVSPGSQPWKLGFLSLATSFVVEASQLLHTPWLDALRATLPGKLLLGSGFLGADLLRYTAGAAFATTCHILVRQPAPPAGTMLPLTEHLPAASGPPAAHRHAGAPEKIYTVAALAMLPPARALVPRVRIAASLEFPYPAPGVSSSGAAQALAWTADSPLLYLFHYNGYFREDALTRIHGPLPGAFPVAAVACCLRDWVPQVRAAAASCIDRTFPQTPASVIAAAGVHLLLHLRLWHRDKDQAAFLMAALCRPDVIPYYTRHIIASSSGPATSLLLLLLRSPCLDSSLEEIALSASQPTVRAAAASALIQGSVAWPSGAREGREISRGQFFCCSPAEPVITRPLAVSSDRDAMIRACLADRSAAVRKTGLEALVRYRLEDPVSADLARPFLASRSPSVRSLAAFITGRHS